MQKVLQRNDSLAKQKWLDYTTGKRRPKESSLNVGVRVLVKQTCQNVQCLNRRQCSISNVQIVDIPHNKSGRCLVNRKTNVNQP